MWLVKGAPNLMQRLSRLPSAPDVTLLDCRKPKPFPWPHTTPPLETRLTSDGVASTYRMHRATGHVKSACTVSEFIIRHFGTTIAKSGLARGQKRLLDEWHKL